MYHHIYLLTVSFSSVLVMFIFLINILIPKTYKRYFSYFVLLMLVPFFLISFVDSKLYYGADASKRSKVIYDIKKSVQKNIEDPSKIKGIIFKNFIFPQGISDLGLSNTDGALLKWFDYKYAIHSGNEIVEIKEGKITFKGPLSFYSQLINSSTYTLDSNNVEVFYLDNEKKKLLSYHDIIDFSNKKNLHQLEKVFSRDRTSFPKRKLTLLLKNPHKKPYIKISFKENVDLGLFEDSLIILNSDPLHSIHVHQNNLYLDMGRVNEGGKYLTLQIIVGQTQYNIREIISTISLSDDIQGEKIDIEPHLDLLEQLSDKYYQIGEVLSFDTKAKYFEFIDWHGAEGSLRWSKKNSKIKFTLGKVPEDIKMFKFRLDADSFGLQEVSLYLNNHFIGRKLYVALPTSLSFKVDSRFLKEFGENIIEFRVPNAQKPISGGDSRILGLALHKFGIIY
ncbi:MAG: hypothetical protein HQK84_01045 [Nitrospinae bacterium]|nr:hypothetical protein [Nitrospinota bacterium]